MNLDLDILHSHCWRKTNIAILAKLLSLLIVQSFIYAQIYKAPEIRPARFRESITINGIFDENSWQSATVIDSFYEINPGNMCNPSVRTQVLLGYDNKILYVGFTCYEDTISKIKATTIKNHKTERILGGTNDLVKIYIKPRIDINESYILYVNPLGIQHTNYYKKEWREVYKIKLGWHAAVNITDSCWTVEIAIPFKNLHLYKSIHQEWQIDFWRIRPREFLYEYSWSPHPNGEFSIYSFMGHMTIDEKIYSSKLFGTSCLW